MIVLGGSGVRHYGAAMAKKPNVIVFFSDQQRHDSTGLHGNPLGLTPHFDRIAKKHTHVQHSFTCQPVCGPARSCLQTGTYATTTGCWRNGIALDPEADTLAKRFNDAGYRTGYIGKWHLKGGRADNADQSVPEAYRGGYQDWLAAEALEFSVHEYKTILYDSDNQPVKLPGYRSDAMTDAAIRYIDQHQHEPFFLFVSYIEPHHQNDVDDYPPPDGYREMYTGKWVPPDLAALPRHGQTDPALSTSGGSTHQHLGGYWGMVKRLDEDFGRMMDALKSLGLDENTIVLFTSDHGCHFKTRNSEYKRSCHEASIRVPTLFAGGEFEGGGALPELVSLVDLPPTLLDAAGLDVPDHMEGRSLMPLVRRERGARDDWPEAVFFQTSEAEIGRGIRTHRWKYHVVAPEDATITDGASDRYAEAFLYDLHYDQHELTNLIHSAAHESVKDELRAILTERIRTIENASPQIELHPTRKVGQHIAR